MTGSYKDHIIIQAMHCDIGVLNEVILGKQRGLSCSTHSNHFIRVDAVQQFCIDKQVFKRLLKLWDFGSASTKNNLKHKKHTVWK